MATTCKEQLTSSLPEHQEDDNPVTAHDWKKEKPHKMQDAGISPVEVEFFDDGTVTFFWSVPAPCLTGFDELILCFSLRRAHSLSVLFFMIAALIYVAVFESVTLDSEYNTKR